MSAGKPNRTKIRAGRAVHIIRPLHGSLLNSNLRSWPAATGRQKLEFASSSRTMYSVDVETIEPLNRPPLARRLGDVVHVSSLLRKICQMSGCAEDRAGEWLLKCAVHRGAGHYQRVFPGDLPPDHPGLSDEELAVALCLGQHPYHSTYIRAAAQLLSSPHTDAPRLATLAVRERVEPVLLHIAAVAARFVPETPPWDYLLRHLPPRLACPPDALPHWSRFVSQTGVTSFNGGPEIQWLHRRAPEA
jgi:hypothetical protein